MLSVTPVLFPGMTSQNVHQKSGLILSRGEKEAGRCVRKTRCKQDCENDKENAFLYVCVRETEKKS